MTLWLVRHAQPLIANGICYGALDMDADPGATQVAAQALALELPHGLDVRVSPLRRCQQLAHALGELRADLRFDNDPRLREMDFGHWEGVAWADIPRAVIDAWTIDFATHRFGGKESANEVLVRVAGAWDELSPRGDTLWITHSGVAQVATLLHRGTRHVEQAKDWPTSTLKYGAWMKFQIEPSE